MKKAMLFFAVIAVMFVLIACDNQIHSYTYDYDELAASVIRVELINYDNPEAKIITRRPGVNIPFEFGKMEILATLQEERFYSFLREFSRQYLWITRNKYLDSPQGVSLRLIHNNGDFEVICNSYANAQYSASFAKNGNVIRFIGSGTRIPYYSHKYFDIQF